MCLPCSSKSFLDQISSLLPQIPPAIPPCSASSDLPGTSCPVTLPLSSGPEVPCRPSANLDSMTHRHNHALINTSFALLSPITLAWQPPK